MAYDQGGLEALRPKPCGGRKRENMTIAQEKALLARFAKAAGAGEMLNIHDLKRAYEQAIGHGTSRSPRADILQQAPMSRPAAALASARATLWTAPRLAPVLMPRCFSALICG